MNFKHVKQLILPQKTHGIQINDPEISKDSYDKFCEKQQKRHACAKWTRIKPVDAKQTAPFLLSTTQLGKFSQAVPLRPHHKTRNPILNWRRLMEPWATDT